MYSLLDIGIIVNLLKTEYLMAMWKILMGKVMFLKINKEISKENEGFLKFVNVQSDLESKGETENVVVYAELLTILKYYTARLVFHMWTDLMNHHWRWAFIQSSSLILVFVLALLCGLKSEHLTCCLCQRILPWFWVQSDELAARNQFSQFFFRLILFL